MIDLDLHRLQGIAGRSNIERPTSNVEWERIKKTKIIIQGLGFRPATGLNRRLGKENSMRNYWINFNRNYFDTVIKNKAA